MAEKLEILKSLKLGARIAEDESEDFEDYFVETDQWDQIFNGEVDVIYGPKGSGKSAIYTLLNTKEDELFDKNTLIKSAENVRGTTIFSSLISSPPPSENAFIYLWKLYSLTLIAGSLRDYEIKNKSAKTLVESLEKAKLLPKSNKISAIFGSVSDYLKKWMNRDAKAVEHALTVDPSTGVTTATRKTEFTNQSDDQNLSDIPVDALLEVANEALEQEDLYIWLLFDRLDVAFADDPELEKNALRALFRAYNDMRAYDRVSLKIFVRNDIWERIIEGGFREASHITRTVNISWTDEGLLNLVVLRLIHNKKLVDYLEIDIEKTKKDYNEQNHVFKRLCPEKIDTGNNPETFGWIVSRVCDATKNTAPREVIHLMDEAKNIQIKKLERGEDTPEGEKLFDRSSIKNALPQVSETRLNQTLLSEYDELKHYILSLKGEKAEQTIISLKKIWKESDGQCLNIARKLVSVGFFETRGDKQNPNFWVPFLYRPALDLVQGKAAP